MNPSRATAPARTIAPARAIANALTLSRALLAPMILFALVGTAGGGAAAALVLTGAALATDYLDGAIARRFHVESRFGKVADAFTDALVFVAIFAGLAARGVLPVWLPAVIAVREAVMYAVIRPALLRMRIDAGARPVGKLKTVLQAAAAIAALVLLLAAPDHARVAALPLAAGAAVLSIASLYWYLEPIAARRGRDRLTVSIAATCVSLWLLQLAIVAVAAELGLASGAAAYALLHTSVAGGLAVLLLTRKRDFAIVGGPRLSRVNPSNVLTLARLTSIPSVIMLITAAADRTAPVWPVLALLSVVLMTDLADGALARRRGQVTRIGSYLDSSTDYLLLGAGAILLLAHGIGTPWVFAVLIGRLALQAGAVLWIAAAGRPLPSATRLGKASIAAGMVLLAVELAAALGSRFLPASGTAPLALTLLELGLTGVLAASAVEKLVLLAGAVRQARAAKS